MGRGGGVGRGRVRRRRDGRSRARGRRRDQGAVEKGLEGALPGKPPGVSVKEDVVRAAGGIVWRRDERGAIELVIVHRPRYDDWSLPKGKLERGETEEQGALREVAEETGLRCKLGGG